MNDISELRNDITQSLKRIGLTPYFEGGTVTLYHAEEIDVLPHLPPESVDVLLTDPPYCSGGATAASRAQDPAKKYCQNGDTLGRPTFAGDHLDQRSFAFWATLWLRLSQRALRTGGYAFVFADWRQLPTMTDVLQAGGITWRGVMPWDKGRSARAPHTGYLRHQAEYVAWGTKGPCRKADGRGPFEGVIHEPVRRNEKRHITGKPVALMRQLVRIAPPGGLILDPFAGSSSTLVSAILEGRRAIAIERSAEYCEIGAKWCQEVLKRGEEAVAKVA